MTVRVNKSSFNIREKLSELERPIGLKGSELMRSETVQEARDFVSAGRRNLIINGAMTIDQRNNGASVTANASYPVDRFIMGDNATGLDISSQRSGISPVGFTSSLSVSVVTAATPGTNESGAFFYQIIEGYNFSPLNFGSSDAKSFTLSFYVRSSVTGTYSCGFRDGGGNVSYTADYTISSANTWEYKTITVPGETSGSYTWNTTNGGALVVSWGLGNGSGRSAAPGSWAAGNNLASTNQVTWCNNSGATFYLTGVQLEVGRNATEFEHRSYGEELALCQRYYYRIQPTNQYSAFCNGWNDGTSASRGVIHFPTIMRTRPTALEQTGTASDYYLNASSGGGVCTSVPTFDTSSTSQASVTWYKTGLTAGQATLHQSNAANVYIAWSAEL